MKDLEKDMFIFQSCSVFGIPLEKEADLGTVTEDLNNFYFKMKSNM